MILSENRLSLSGSCWRAEGARARDQGQAPRDGGLPRRLAEVLRAGRTLPAFAGALLPPPLAADYSRFSGGGDSVRMRTIRLRVAGMIALALCAPALAACGVGPGLTGNDTGGIIQWTPANEAHALEMATAYCAKYNKYARITSDHPRYGDYVVFACSWRPLYGAPHRRHVAETGN